MAPNLLFCACMSMCMYEVCMHGMLVDGGQKIIYYSLRLVPFILCLWSLSPNHPASPGICLSTSPELELLPLTSQTFYLSF